MPHTRFHDAIADSMADAEQVVEDAIGGRSAYVVRLLREPSARDETIWRRAFRAAARQGARFDEDDWAEDFDVLADWPKEARDFAWQQFWTTAMSAALAQYDAENIIRPLWEALERGQSRVMAEAAGLARPLSREAIRGPGKARFAAAREGKRNAKNQD